VASDESETLMVATDSHPFCDVAYVSFGCADKPVAYRDILVSGAGASSGYSYDAVSLNRGYRDWHPAWQVRAEDRALATAGRTVEKLQFDAKGKDDIRFIISSEIDYSPAIAPKNGGRGAGFRAYELVIAAAGVIAGVHTNSTEVRVQLPALASLSDPLTPAAP
jgi:hypothetical protein